MRYRISYVMDEIWERAVETALDGQTDALATRTLTLDGAVKCVQGRLPRPNVLERFQNLEHLSIANIGVSSLEQFPRLRNLQKLILSDNRIAGGLEFLVQAELDSLRDLDLSNNRIQYVEDLLPLAQLKLVSLDLYECPVTRVKDYRSRVFGLIKSLKYLDKMDSEENERPESDEEEYDDEEEEEEEEEGEDDPGSCDGDVEERPCVVSNGHNERMDGIVEVDGEEESDADEEEIEPGRSINGMNHHHEADGFRVEAVNAGDEEVSGEDDESDSGEEGIDEEDGDDDDEDEDDDVVEVHEIEDSDDDEDGVEDADEDEVDDDYGDGNEEEVDNDEGDSAEPESNGLLLSTEGEIDGHEQGEDDDDGDGETGEDEQGVDDDGDFDEEEEGEEEGEEDCGEGYLVQPVVLEHENGVGDVNEAHEEDAGEEEEEVEDDDDDVQLVMPSSSSNLKRKRDDGDNPEDDEDDEGSDDDDVVQDNNSKNR